MADLDKEIARTDAKKALPRALRGMWSRTPVREARQTTVLGGHYSES